MGDRPAPPSRAAIAATYERIAPHFDATRSRPWPPVIEFVDAHDPVECALDLGCGNGRHFDALTRVATWVIGIDLSRALVEIARDRYPGVHTVVGDAVELPVQSDTVDLCLYVATLHHVPSIEARQRSLAEIHRVLRPDGHALISCWSVTHEKFDAERGHDRWVDWTLPDGTVIPRFYHIFDLHEFTAELDGSPVQVERTFERDGNCYAIIRGT